MHIVRSLRSIERIAEKFEIKLIFTLTFVYKFYMQQVRTYSVIFSKILYFLVKLQSEQVLGSTYPHRNFLFIRRDCCCLAYSVRNTHIIAHSSPQYWCLLLGRGG